jgi:hypothetical protein
MQSLPTVILRHETLTGTHFDWLIAPPAAVADWFDDPARLWSARLPLPPWHWATVRRFLVQTLPPHRRHYLTHQGPIGGGRGCVTRVDVGRVVPRRWTLDQIDLRVTAAHFSGRLRLWRVSDDRWVVTANERG